MRRRVPVAVVRTEVTLPIRFADGFEAAGRVITFRGLVDGREHLAVSFDSPTGERALGPRLVRLHSECLTGDVLGSERCDCGPQLRESVERLAEVGGVLLYLRQEGRGIGLYAKLDAYALQEQGLDTYQANRALGFREDARNYTVAVQMLRALGITALELLSNNPDKVRQLRASGLVVSRVVPTLVHWNPANARYLETKATRSAHTLDVAARRER